MSPRRFAILGVAFVAGAFGCAGDTVDGTPGTGGGSAGAPGGAGGGAGTSSPGAGGSSSAGSGGVAGSGGSIAGDGGVAGRGGSTGGSAGNVAGTSGQGGTAGGNAGRGGVGGTAGAGGSVAGRGGTGGTAGAGGGVAGRGGIGGTAGIGGGSGRGGASGTGGAAGRGGTGGGAGTGGSCATGQTMCPGGACRNLTNDNANCGSCGNVCSGGQTCMNSVCMGGSSTGCPHTNPVLGWATQGGGTTGGGNATPMVVTTASALSSALSNASVSVIELNGSVSGSFNVPSNKTLQGACGGQATITGHVGIGARTNVIVRNLRIVGRNCTDASNCEDGEDALEIGQSSRVWVDHCDISDGSDGNLDITNGADLVTVSYTKFWYRGRSGGHQFSNLIGNSDTNSGDAGKLRVTWHHNWWADRVVERQPRVRYGQVHLFNNLWTSSGNNYCVGVGANANVLVQNNVFIGVSDPMNTGDYSNGSSIAHQEGNIFTNTNGMTADLRGGSVFSPPYTVTLDAASTVEAAVRAGAGPK